MTASSGPTCPSYITLLLYTAPIIIYLHSIANYDQLGVKSSEKQHHYVTLQFPGTRCAANYDRYFQSTNL